jgi:hypothetical protein
MPPVGKSTPKGNLKMTSYYTIADRLWKPQIPNIFVQYEGIQRVLDTPKSAKLDLGLTEIERASVSQLGIEVIVARQITAQKPKVDVQFSGLTEEVWEILTGNLWQQSASVATYYGRNRFAKDLVTIPADTSGFEGYGVVQDAVGIASVYKDGKSVALTQEGYSAFTGSNPLTWAVGANGAVKFSTDTLQYQKSFRIPQTLTGVRTNSASQLKDLRLGFTVLDASLFVYRFDASSAQPILDGTSVDFSADSQTVSFQIKYDGSTCQPYTFISTGRQIQC